jgi:hypothetical protein
MDEDEKIAKQINENRTRDVLNGAGKIVIDNLVSLPPLSEITAFSVVAIISHRHFRSNEYNLAIQNENSTVVPKR